MALTARRPSRREFLEVSAHTGLSAAALSLGGGVLRPRAGVAQPGTTGVREIPLEAREVGWELAPGKVVRAMAYNGRVPGPELRVREGERIRIRLTNRLAEPTTIHWHGVDVPNAMDGCRG